MLVPAFLFGLGTQFSVPSAVILQQLPRIYRCSRPLVAGYSVPRGAMFDTLSTVSRPL